MNTESEPTSKRLSHSVIMSKKTTAMRRSILAMAGPEKKALKTPPRPMRVSADSTML